MSNHQTEATVSVHFELGSVYATPDALAAIEEAEQTPGDFIQRHLSKDWGELDEHDSRLNDAAVRSGEDRILSAYRTSTGATIWCITEWDRSATTLLLPEEY